MFFRITGGEPLLSRGTFKVLDWIRDNPLPHLELSVNSNMGVGEELVERFSNSVRELLEHGKIKSFMLQTSIDTYGAQAEYIRTGLKFGLFERNLTTFLETVPKASVAFMSTFNNLSVVGYRRFLDWVLEFRRKYENRHRQVWLDIPHLVEPRHQAAWILTEDYQDRMRELISSMEAQAGEKAGIRTAEVDKMRRILAWMQEPRPAELLRQARRDFHLFFSEADRRRKTAFLEAFPEMQDFWSLCERLR
jgi:hypothetical protein